jgi:5-methylcytosine-specific restriction endonuclease McrA
MSVPCQALAVASSAPRPEVLARLAAVAWQLQPVAPADRRHLLRDEASLLVDGLLVRVARGHGAVEVALGEGLDALATGDRVLRLGWSSLGDYARERLGLAPGTALRLARLARALRDRPRLRAAVRSGEVSARKAEAVLPVARGEEEAGWVERARTETVRALAAAVRAAGAGDAEPDEPWAREMLSITPGERARVDAALALAGDLLGATAPVWRRVEAVCEEYLGAHPVDLAPEEAAALTRDLCLERDLDALREGLEHEYRRWEALGEPERFEAPPGPPPGDLADPLALDARLLELAAMREAWDALVGHLGSIVQSTGLWRWMGFASLGHYAAERLGMSGRALEQRAALERRLWDLPALRAALRDGRLSYEKARLVAAHAGGEDAERLVALAAGLPCVALRRALESRERAQMCERRELGLALPRRVALLLRAAVRAAREAAGRWLTHGEALAAVADHFVATWGDARPDRSTAARRALARDRGLCQVPGCSRPAVHAHHVVYRSRGGTDDAHNLVGLCGPHHLHGVHRGFVRVTGRAPDGLAWEVPAPPRP